jgi:hypothetical protein
VEWIIEHSEGGHVYLIQIPSEGPNGRKVVPISKMASFLPRPYRTIGLLESEVGITGQIHTREITCVKKARSVLSRLKRQGPWPRLVAHPQSVDPESFANLAFN